MNTLDAIEQAQKRNLDVVEVSPNSDPPVCRIMNFGKFVFEQNKKAQSNKKKQKQMQVKEIKFRTSTEDGDYNIKIKKLMSFLESGDKAKVTLRFRGREFDHKHLGLELMEKVKSDLESSGLLEQEPQLEGRQMVMVFAPKK